MNHRQLIKSILLAISQVFILSSCLDFSLDGHEQHMAVECKCEAFSVNSEMYISEKNGKPQPCARTVGDTLKWGYVIDNDDCEPFQPFIYENAREFNEGVAPVMMHGKWGLIDSSGKLILNYTFQDLQAFQDSLAAFQGENNLWGFINARGDSVVKPQFKLITNFHANLSFADHPQKGWRVINTRGQTLPIKIDSLDSRYGYHNQVLSVQRGHLAGGGIYNELIECSFYMKGKHMTLVGFREMYMLVPDSVKVRYDEIDQLRARWTVNPIFQ